MKMTTERLFLTDPPIGIISNTCKQISIGALYCYNLTLHHCNFSVAYRVMQSYMSFLETKFAP
jgi:hypothetical protein